MPSNDSDQKAQLDLQNQLQQQQQAQETQRLNAVQTSLFPYLSGTQGFTPQQLSILNSQALDQSAQRGNQATIAANASVNARGDNGLTPMSGVGANTYGNLQAAKAGDLSSSLQNVGLNNAQQALANQFNANSVISGNAQTLAGNVGTYGSGAAGALNAVTTAQQGGFLNNFTKALGQGLGGAAGTYLSGGAGNLTSGLNWGGSAKG